MRPKENDSVARQAILPLCYTILALWAVHVFFLGHLVFTGDEVRYVAYGLGVFGGEGFHPSDAAWRAMLGELSAAYPLKESPAGHAGALIHSVVYPLLGSPAIFLGGLEGARWFSFGVGTAGLVILFYALRRRFDQPTSLAAILAVAFACPLVLYFRLFFAEILLFSCNCLVASFFVSQNHKNPKYLFWAGLGFCLLPFIHVKLSLEAATAFVILLFAARRQGVPPARLVALLGLAGGVFLLYLLHNHVLFGAAIGGGNPAFPVTPLAIPDRVLVNLFDMRHGLVPNAPHLLFALIGLVLAVRDKDPRDRILAALFAAYFFTMLWANGSEAYASRNWAAAMPFVAFGFARWLRGNTLANYICAVPFFALSLCLFCVLLKYPSAFLDSRNYSVPYDKLFEMLPAFHFGYLLPYDFLDHQDAALHTALPLGLAVLGVLGLFAAGQILISRPRPTRRAGIGLAFQGLALATIVFFSLVEKVDQTAAVIVADAERYYANVHLDRPRRLAFLRLDNAEAAMKPYGFFLVSLMEHGTVVNSLIGRASVIVPLPPFTPADAVMIAETSPRPDRRWLDSASTAAVYRRLLALPGLGD
jgi:hypothetical protein